MTGQCIEAFGEMLSQIITNSPLMEKLSIKNKAFTILYCSAKDISFEKYVIVKTEQVNSFLSVGCDPFSVPIVLIFSQ